MSEESSGSSFKFSDKRRFDSEGQERVESEGSAEHSDKIKEPGEEFHGASKREYSSESSQISFSAFVFSLATQALMQLGEIPPPPGVDLKVDAAAAKQTIDILMMLKEKTKGNLEASESNLLEEILHNCQMGFVRAGSASSK